MFSDRTLRSLCGALLCVIVCIPHPAAAQWHSLGLPFGGTANAFVEIAGSNGARLYAATTNGVFRSTDHAASWGPVGLQRMNVSSLVQLVSPSDEVLFAVATPYDTGAEALYRSLDSGKSWTSCYVATGRDAAHGIVSMLTVGSDVLIALGGTDTLGGLMMTTDVGRHWSRFAWSPNALSMSAAVACGKQIVALTTSSEIWQMPTAGGPWSKGAPPTSGGFPNLNALVVWGQDIFAAGDGVYLSTDYGANWTRPINTGMPQYANLTSLAVNGLQMIAFDEQDGGGLFYSADGARTWTASMGGLGFPHVDQPGALGYCDGRFFAGPSQGIMVSTNGTDWVSSMIGERASGLRDIAAPGTMLLALSGRGVYRSGDRGLSWKSPALAADLHDSNAYYSYLHPSGESDGTLFAAGGDDLARWDGAEWTLVADVPITSIATAEDALIGAAGTLHLMRSTDDGRSWSALNTLPDTAEWTAAVLTADDRLYAFEEFNTYPPRLEVYRSTNQGATWSFVSRLPTPGGVLSCAALNGVIYVASSYQSGALIVSSDAGATWSNTGFIASGLVAVKGRIIASVQGKGLMALADQNGGRDSVLLPIATTPATGFAADDMYAYTAGVDGLWQAPLAGLPLGVAAAPRPLSTTAISCYPDPAASLTTISADLAKPTHITLSIYDARGVLCLRAFDGSVAAGQFECPVDLRGLANGAYSVRLADGARESVGRLVVTR